MIYTNIDGLSSKLLKLETIIDMNKPDIICITETKLDPSVDDVTLGLKDYNI